jgi:pimeloyl-ACP methyl ester carboxylesterase
VQNEGAQGALTHASFDPVGQRHLSRWTGPALSKMMTATYPESSFEPRHHEETVMQRHSPAFLGALVAFGAAITGCGRTSDPSHATAVSQPSVLLAVLGGNASCGRDSTGAGNSPYGQDMWPALEQLDQQLTTDGYRVDYFVSCHNSDSALHYATSLAPSQVQVVPYAQTTTLLDDLRETTGAERMFVAGHSYGGWLAMKTVLALGSDIDGLVTIDPISRVKCTFATPFGCTTAPTDIETNARNTIADRTGNWENFYQLQTGYLHASPIDQADGNTELFVGHTRIESEVDVWSTFARQVRTLLK